jgi:outer membrane immunogenic protein
LGVGGKLKTSLVWGAVAVGLLTAPAIAADLPLKAPPYVAPIDYYWTGWFVGANAGGAWDRSDVSSNFSCPAGGLCSVNAPANLANVTNAAAGSISASGFTGGGQLGYNWQSGALVYGVETDFNALDLRGSRAASVASVTTPSVFNPAASVETNWLYTLRGRVGWTWTPRVLLYATGGLAVADLKVANSYTTTNNPANTAAGASSASSTMSGWTVGAGAEWALLGNWRVKVEYLYVDFGSVGTAASVNNGTFPNSNVLQTSADLKTHIARLGLNLRF